MHGGSTLSHVEYEILQDFIDKFVAVESRTSFDVGRAFLAAHQATLEEYADVYYSKLDVVISGLLANGTEHILDWDNDQARFHASLACFFEERTAVHVRKSKVLMNWAQVYELHCADDNTLVQYFRKRIPSACLDKKYKEVKSVKKMGYCYNPNCSLPGRKAERSKMFYCTRCGEVNYCSSECQKADWKTHRKFCDIMLEVKAAFI